MRVAVHDRAHAKTVDRFLQPARSEERKNFRIFADNGGADRRVVEHGDAALVRQFSQRLLEPQRLIERFLDKRFHERFAPGVEHPPAESAAKPSDSGEASTADLDRFAIEHGHAAFLQNLTHLLRLTRFEIVVAENADHRHAHRCAQISNQLVRFLGEAVIGQVAAEQENVGLLRDLFENFEQRAARMFPVMHIGNRGDAKSSHANRNGAAAADGCLRRCTRGGRGLRFSGRKPRRMPESDSSSNEFFRRSMELLAEARLPFLLGGAYAFCVYTGIARHTKDFDLFVRQKDFDEALAIFRRAGFHSDKTFPHWLGKARSGDDSIDIIYRAGNGLCPVDDLWFERAPRREVLGLEVGLCPPEEMIWMKAFIMERERFDGADVAHLLRHCAAMIDWAHLLRRFGEDWRVLLSHLILFGYIFPAEKDRVPPEVLQELVARLPNEKLSPNEKQTCRGTLLSRAQYLTDIGENGLRDARLDPRTRLTPAEIAAWTKAIEPHMKPHVVAPAAGD